MVDYKCTCRVQKKLMHENCTWQTVQCIIYTHGLQFPLFSSVHNAPVLCIVTNTTLRGRKMKGGIGLPNNLAAIQIQKIATYDLDRKKSI